MSKLGRPSRVTFPPRTMEVVLAWVPFHTALAVGNEAPVTVPL